MRNPILLVIGMVFLFQNCATTPPQFKKTAVYSSESGDSSSLLESRGHEFEEIIKESTPFLSLNQAISLTLLHNPSLAIYPYEIRAQEDLALQASLIPNPEIDLGFENFAGTGDLKIGNGLEFTTMYSQLIERGGKRTSRYQLGLWETEKARWDYRISRVNMLTEMALRFLDVLSAQEQVAILEELVRLGEEALYAIRERVQAGRVSPLEETRATVELATERNALDRTLQELLAAKELLAAMWGGNESTFHSISGSLDSIQTIPQLRFLLQQIKNNPDIQQWAIEISRRQALLDLEKSQAVSDVTWSAGIRYLNETADGALVAGFSMPLPFFNRNQGAIQAAQERLKKADQERSALINDIRSQLASFYQTLVGHQMEIGRLRQDILPGAEQAYAAAREGYRQGKFDYLDVIDAQRTLFQARVGTIQSLAAFHKQWIRLERLIGRPLQEIIENSSTPGSEESTE